MQNNNRRHHRLQVSPSILRGSQFKLVDLSQSGAQLYSDLACSKGKKINLLLQLDDLDIVVNAVVRWCMESRSIFSTGFNLGVEFVDIRISTQVAIKKYLINQLELEDNTIRKAV